MYGIAYSSFLMLGVLNKRFDNWHNGMLTRVYGNELIDSETGTRSLGCQRLEAFLNVRSHF